MRLAICDPKRGISSSQKNFEAFRGKRPRRVQSGFNRRFQGTFWPTSGFPGALWAENRGLLPAISARIGRWQAFPPAFSGERVLLLSLGIRFRDCFPLRSRNHVIHSLKLRYAAASIQRNSRHADRRILGAGSRFQKALNEGSGVSYPAFGRWIFAR